MSSELASTSVSTFPVEASDEYELEIVPASLPTGLIEFPVTLTANSTSGTPLPSMSVRVIGRIVKDVQCFPRSLTLGICAPGESFDERVELRSLTMDSFDVTGVQTTDDRLAVREAGPRNVFRVLGRTAGEGLQSNEVTFAVSHRDGTTYPVTLPVRYVVAKSASSSR